MPGELIRENTVILVKTYCRNLILGVFQRSCSENFIKFSRMFSLWMFSLWMFSLEIYEEFRTAIPSNKQNMFIAILLRFFITCFVNFIYSELPNSTQTEAYSEPYQRFKIQFLAKIVSSSKGVFRTESNMQDKAFWEIFFQLSTSRYTKSSILDVRLRS